MFNTHCTHCGASNQSPPHYKSLSIKCGTCGDKFIALEDFERSFKFHCSACGGSIEAEQGMKGSQATCPHCNQDILIVEDSTPEPPTYSMNPTAVSPPLPAAGNNKPNNDFTSPASTMKEYKVLTQKDKWFGREFDPEKLEQAVNAYAAQGWRVISCATAEIPSFTGSREEMIIILERDK